MLYTPGVLSLRSSFTDQRKLGIFLDGRPMDLMLRLDSIRLVRSKVVLTKGRRAPEVTLSKGGATLHWIEGSLHLPVAVAILPESIPEELQVVM
jgi:hypothetical protein